MCFISNRWSCGHEQRGSIHQQHAEQKAHGIAEVKQAPLSRSGECLGNGPNHLENGPRPNCKERYCPKIGVSKPAEPTAEDGGCAADQAKQYQMDELNLGF